MLWIRDYEVDRKWLNGRKIIHGHTPVNYVEVKDAVMHHRPKIDLDNGCVYPYKEGMGYLCGLELTQWGFYKQQNIDMPPNVGWREM